MADEPDRDDVMQRTRAARMYTNNQPDPALDMAAFLALFHPELSDDERRALAQGQRR